MTCIKAYAWFRFQTLIFFFYVGKSCCLLKRRSTTLRQHSCQNALWAFKCNYAPSNAMSYTVCWICTVSSDDAIVMLSVSIQIAIFLLPMLLEPSWSSPSWARRWLPSQGHPLRETTPRKPWWQILKMHLFCSTLHLFRFFENGFSEIRTTNEQFYRHCLQWLVIMDSAGLSLRGRLASHRSIIIMLKNSFFLRPRGPVPSLRPQAPAQCNAGHPDLLLASVILHLISDRPSTGSTGGGWDAIGGF